MLFHSLSLSLSLFRHSFAMDRYQKVERPKPESPINENEIRITTQGAIRNYITYASSLLQVLFLFRYRWFWRMRIPCVFCGLGVFLWWHFRELGFGFCLICLFAECWFKGLSIDGVCCMIGAVLCFCSRVAFGLEMKPFVCDENAFCVFLVVDY